MNFKKCTRCKKNLPIEDFEKYYGERGQTDLRSSRSSYCKECRSELRLINLLKKKYYIIKTIFNGKCYECDTGLEYLPCFEFHHINPDLKTTVWNHIKFRSIDNIKKWIKEENVVLLCSNCHELKKDKYLTDFQNLILKSDLFKRSPEDIDELINLAINKHPTYINFKDFKRNIKIQIKKYIRKRYVFNQLYFGKCTGCGKANVLNFLPALELHHLNPDKLLLKSNWRDIANQDCISIIGQIIKEDCICLCSNCHILVASKMNSYLVEVIEDSVTRTLFSKNYTKIISNVSNFNINRSKIDLRSPLKLKFSQDEFWKIHLMQIYIFLNNNNKNDFRVVDLAKILNHKPRSVRYYLDKLTSLHFVSKAQDSSFPFNNNYRLTELGRNTVGELKQSYNETYRSLKFDITSMEEYMNRQNKWII